MSQVGWGRLISIKNSILGGGGEGGGGVRGARREPALGAQLSHPSLQVLKDSTLARLVERAASLLGSSALPSAELDAKHGPDGVTLAVGAPGVAGGGVAMMLTITPPPTGGRRRTQFKIEGVGQDKYEHRVRRCATQCHKGSKLILLLAFAFI